MAENNDGRFQQEFGGLAGIMVAADLTRQKIDEAFEAYFAESMQLMGEWGSSPEAVERCRRVLRRAFDGGIATETKAVIRSEAVKLAALGKPDALEDMSAYLRAVAVGVRVMTSDDHADKG
jgi:hypothetical protein